MNNKDIIIRFSNELWEKRNFDIVDELFAEDAILHSPMNVKKGSLTMKDLAQKWLDAFPDLLVTWDDFIAEGDIVVVRWHAHGTHIGGFFNTAPTHREINYTGVTTFKLKDGKVIEYWALVDIHAILSQLEDIDSISEVVS